MVTDRHEAAVSPPHTIGVRASTSKLNPNIVRHRDAEKVLRFPSGSIVFGENSTVSKVYNAAVPYFSSQMYAV